MINHDIIIPTDQIIELSPEVLNSHLDDVLARNLNGEIIRLEVINPLTIRAKGNSVVFDSPSIPISLFNCLLAHTILEAPGCSVPAENIASQFLAENPGVFVRDDLWGIEDNLRRHFNEAGVFYPFSAHGPMKFLLAQVLIVDRRQEQTARFVSLDTLRASVFHDITKAENTRVADLTIQKASEYSSVDQDTTISQLNTHYRKGENWRASADCIRVNTEIFFAETIEGESLAKKICKPCPVRTACLEYAIARKEVDGIWGGVNQDERRSIVRGRNSRARLESNQS